MQKQEMIKQAAQEQTMRKQIMQKQRPNNSDVCDKCNQSNVGDKMKPVLVAYPYVSVN